MAGRKPNNPPMTPDQMIEYVGNKKTDSKLYKAEVRQMSDDGITKSVQKAIHIVKSADSTGRVNLEDTNKVKSIVGAYLETCAFESVIPSMTDIAMCLGHTRQNMYRFMRDRRDSETGKFLQQVHDIIANTLADNALKGNVNNITAIFLLKALYGLSETENIVLTNQPYDDNETSGSEWKDKYRNLIPE